jgi:hypothetical protein
MPMTARDRRTLIIGGVILGVMLVGYLLLNVVLGGGDDTGGAALPPISVGPSQSTQTPTQAPTATGSPVINFTGRDPFSIPGALAPTVVPTSPTVTVSGTTTITITPTNTVSPTTSPTTTPTQPGGGSSITIGGHTVVLLDTFTSGGGEVAQVEVDGKVYSVSEGETFAQGQFELITISGDCATFLYGDEQFTLCATSPK